MQVTDSSTSRKLQGNPAQVALQHLLLIHLSKARVRNPSYSLRSMAQRIKISPAALSEILNGKRRVSVKMAEKILHGLNIPPDEVMPVIKLFSTNGQNLKNSQKFEFSELANDQFKIISNWYHFAILSLTETEDFRNDPRWIADRLNVRVSDIELAIDRLLRLGMLRRGVNGRLESTGEQFATTDEITSSAVRGFHSEVLELARNSLESVPLEKRDFTTMTMAVDPKRLIKAKKMIRTFRAKLCEYLEQGDRTEIYQLSINLFPLSQNVTPPSP
jgi:transcriptional regulator with XRE-family HTH domain